MKYEYGELFIMNSKTTAEDTKTDIYIKVICKFYSAC